MDKFPEAYNHPRLNEVGRNRKPEQTSYSKQNWISNWKTSNKQKFRITWLYRWILPNIFKRINAYPSWAPWKHWRRNTSKLILQGQYYSATKDTTSTKRRQETIVCTIIFEEHCHNCHWTALPLPNGDSYHFCWAIQSPWNSLARHSKPWARRSNWLSLGHCSFFHLASRTWKEIE